MQLWSTSKQRGLQGAGAQSEYFRIVSRSNAPPVHSRSLSLGYSDYSVMVSKEDSDKDEEEEDDGPSAPTGSENTTEREMAL